MPKNAGSIRTLKPHQKISLILTTLAAAGLLSSCLSEEPPEPEVQPLEIIAGGSQHGGCSLNVEEVGAGTHEVTPMTGSGTATVRILDPSGEVLFKRVIELHPAKGGGQVVRVEEMGSVRLRPGDHRVECILAEGTSSTTLRVVPARPGH